MLGQFLVDPEPELELEPDEPELVLPEPELPVLELEDGVVVDGVVVEELELEPAPELPAVVVVVAALATSAPPVRRPQLSAPMASTFRRRICMGALPFRVIRSAGPSGPAPHTLRRGPERGRTTT
jgi:hypothetical protein